MKAAVHYKFGPPDVLSIKEIDKPVNRSDEILVKVYAATVNRTDCGWLFAKPAIMRLFAGFTKPRKPVTGTDFAGIVEAVGTEVTNFKPGDRVFGFDDNCISSHAQYIVVPVKKAVEIIPDHISFEQAAASIEGAHYAYNFITKLPLKAGDKVLLNGASGAIGSAGLQLLKNMGVEVTAVCNTKNVDLIKSLGADYVVDYEKDDFTKLPVLFDYIFDAVGKSSFGKCKPIMKKNAIYVSSELGEKSQNVFYALTTPYFGKKKVIFPLPVNIKRSLEVVTKLLKDNKFNPVIDRVYQLDQIADAFRYVASGEKIGNVIISIPE